MDSLSIEVPTPLTVLRVLINAHKKEAFAPKLYTYVGSAYGNSPTDKKERKVSHEKEWNPL